ncbi:MAG: ABC transporter permease [Vulcanimicrobiaceae bacterium]
MIVSADDAQLLAGPDEHHASLKFGRMLAARLAFSLVVLFVLSVVVFAATTVLPGNVADIVLGQDATPAARAALVERLHLDRPAPVRYVTWLEGALHLDFGKSLQSDTPVWPAVADAFGRSLILAAVAGVVMIVSAVLVGLWAGLRVGTLGDRLFTLLTFGALSMPEFVLGAILIWLFVIVFPILPALSLVGPDTSLAAWITLLVLPVATIVPVTGAYIVRTMRSAVIEVARADFIEMAALRGLSPRCIVWRHILPNALVPMINVLTLNLGWLVGGIVVVEVLFQYPGIGRLLLESAQQRDIPMVQGAALVIGTVYVTLNLVADVAISFLDPRVGRLSVRP